MQNLPAAGSQALARLAARHMRLQCTIQDGQIWVADADHTVPLALAVVKGPPPPSRP